MARWRSSGHYEVRNVLELLNNKKKTSETFLWRTYFKFIWYISYIHWLKPIVCNWWQNRPVGLWRNLKEWTKWPNSISWLEKGLPRCTNMQGLGDTKVWAELKCQGIPFSSWKLIFNRWHLWNPLVHVQLPFNT